MLTSTIRILIDKVSHHDIAHDRKKAEPESEKAVELDILHFAEDFAPSYEDDWVLPNNLMAAIQKHKIRPRTKEGRML